MNDMVMKLDEWGRPAWIGLLVLSFIVFWPIGLALLAFLIWSGRMGCRANGGPGHWKSRFADKWDSKMQKWSDGGGSGRSYGGLPRSGNRAFDEYRVETLKRLEDEQREFEDFLERLRLARDRSEFDQFMADRRERPATPTADAPAADEPRGSVPQV